MQVLTDWNEDKRLFLVEDNVQVEHLQDLIQREYGCEVGSMVFVCEESIIPLVNQEGMQMENSVLSHKIKQ